MRGVHQFGKKATKSCTLGVIGSDLIPNAFRTVRRFARPIVNNITVMSEQTSRPRAWQWTWFRGYLLISFSSCWGTRTMPTTTRWSNSYCIRSSTQLRKLKRWAVLHLRQSAGTCVRGTPGFNQRLPWANSEPAWWAFFCDLRLFRVYPFLIAVPQHFSKLKEKPLPNTPSRKLCWIKLINSLLFPAQGRISTYCIETQLSRIHQWLSFQFKLKPTLSS